MGPGYVGEAGAGPARQGTPGGPHRGDSGRGVGLVPRGGPLAGPPLPLQRLQPDGAAGDQVLPRLRGRRLPGLHVQCSPVPRVSVGQGAPRWRFGPPPRLCGMRRLPPAGPPAGPRPLLLPMPRRPVHKMQLQGGHLCPAQREVQDQSGPFGGGGAASTPAGRGGPPPGRPALRARRPRSRARESWPPARPPSPPGPRAHASKRPHTHTSAHSPW